MMPERRLDPPDPRITPDGIEDVHGIADSLVRLATDLEGYWLDGEARSLRELAEDIKHAVGPIPPDEPEGDEG